MPRPDIIYTMPKWGCAAVARKRKSVNHELISKGRQPLCSGRNSRSTWRTPTKGKQKGKKASSQQSLCIENAQYIVPRMCVTKLQRQDKRYAPKLVRSSYPNRIPLFMCSRSPTIIFAPKKNRQPKNFYRSNLNKAIFECCVCIPSYIHSSRIIPALPILDICG